MHHDTSRDAPPTSFIKPHAKYKHGVAAKALFCRNIMDACEAMEYGSESSENIKWKEQYCKRRSGRECLEGVRDHEAT